MKPKPILLATAFGLAGFSAIVHLLLGVNGLLESAADGAALLRPLAFILVATLVFALIAAFLGGVVAPRPLYATGALLMFAHVFAYADVHGFGFLESTTGADLHDHGHDGHDHDHDDHGHDDGHGHDHDDHNHDDHNHDDHSHESSTGRVVLEHLADDLTALTTKLAETASAMAFLALYLLDRS